MTGESRRRAALATLTGTGLTVGITVVQAFLLIPLCLTHLGTRLYGAWLGASEWLVWIQLLDVGIPNLLTQRVGAAIGHGDRDAAARWSATSLGLLALVGCGLTAAGLYAAPIVGRWAQVVPEQLATFTRCFRLGVGASALLLVSNGAVGLARGVQRTALVNGAQVLGALLGLAVSVGLLIAGWGLWALAWGLVTRAAVSALGGLWFLARLPVGGTSWWTSPSLALTSEVAALAPSMSSASLGRLLANNSEILLVTTLFGPVPAAVYALTRRAIDGLRNLLDSIAWAVYGGFAHLVTADDRHRSRGVLHDILWLRLALACLCASIAVAVNRTFVTRLFGAEQFGGVELTMIFALQMVLAGQMFLTNFLLRATGQVREGSWMLTAEAACRLAAMTAGLLVAGPIGAPAAACVTSLTALVAMRRRLDAALPRGSNTDAEAPPANVAIAPWAVFAAGVAAAAAMVHRPPTWPAAAATAGVLAVVGSALLWIAMGLVPGRRSLFRWPRA